MISQNHKVTYRIYYEDTDAGGVVYYANYLKFAERARTELLRDLGVNQSELNNAEGVLFVVKNVNMEIIKPARLDDLIEVHTILENLGGASVEMLQKIEIDGVAIADIKVKIVSIDRNFKPIRMPKNLFHAN
jgi:acyl-CoA thioester hydrolase